MTTDQANDVQWSTCSEIARRYGRSFYLASLFLPRHRRTAIHATYAYCRVADDIVDEAGSRSFQEIEDRLQAWQDQLNDPRDPVAIAFARARSEFNIPIQAAIDLLEGIRMDLEPRRYATWEELRRYCYGVAGTVGLLSAPILGCANDGALERAAELGIAMQLTNILRDVDEDAVTGRLYLPLDELAMFGCDPEAVLARRADGDFVQLIQFQIARARSLYASSLRGLPALTPSGRLTTLAAARFYAGILNEIEAAGCDVFRGRARVSSVRKLRQTPGLAADFIRLSLTPARFV
jgi:phytoene synthase